MRGSPASGCNSLRGRRWTEPRRDHAKDRHVKRYKIRAGASTLEPSFSGPAKRCERSLSGRYWSATRRKFSSTLPLRCSDRLGVELHAVGAVRPAFMAMISPPFPFGRSPLQAVTAKSCGNDAGSTTSNVAHPGDGARIPWKQLVAVVPTGQVLPA